MSITTKNFEASFYSNSLWYKCRVEFVHVHASSINSAIVIFLSSEDCVTNSPFVYMLIHSHLLK